MLTMKSLKTLAAAGVLALMAGGASAATVTTDCPGTATTADREFSVTIEGPPAATCVYFGNGPSGPGTSADILAAVSPALLLDKTDSVGSSGVVLTTTGSTSGFWSILVPNGFTLSNVHLLFQVGTQGNSPNQLDPDWAIFSIPDGILSGSWSTSANQALSHANVYGTLAPIPLPAAGFLLIGALGGLGLLARRRRTAA